MAFYTAASEPSSRIVPDISDETNIVDDLSIIPLEKDSFGELLFGCRYCLMLDFK